ncbi:MAG TPA: peroxiredoxin family protein [Pirellulales bacterium]|jgi:peroxiredoxin|nr:peroxiredoxin family protein [Pirellulales bacterium]
MLKTCFAPIVFGLFAIAASGAAAEDAAKVPLAVGDQAPDASLPDLHGDEVGLKKLFAAGPVALVVLRGYPGYQCPLCNRQAGELLARAEDFSKAGAQVVMVYPGSAKQLDEHARQFIAGKKFPAHYRFLLDPDYRLVEAYGLRWNAPQETAYPSSFVVNRQGEITFAAVSRSHGGRTPAAELIKAIERTRRTRR